MKMVSLTSAQNGRHSHTTLLDEANIMGVIDGNISFQARAVPVRGITTGTSGNGSSHENMQPSLCLKIRSRHSIHSYYNKFGQGSRAASPVSLPSRA